MLLLLVMMINEFRHTSWIQLVLKFSEAGPADSGQVTLVFDDCKPTQAHRSWVGNLFKVLVL